MRFFNVVFKILLLVILSIIAFFLFKISISIGTFDNKETSNMLNPVWVHIETPIEYKARLKHLEQKLYEQDIPSEKDLIKFNNEYDIGG
ncbi:MAG: hypothetical protein Q4E83_06875 [bacterium]|nr:hypothetical protein [bacterium]